MYNNFTRAAMCRVHQSVIGVDSGYNTILVGAGMVL
jgi:hypothetical protein